MLKSPLEGGRGVFMARRKILPYNPILKDLARELRNSSTLSEILLWNQVKNRQIRGHQFLRQRQIDNYIVDFFCPELMLAIEIDGSTHDFKVSEDRLRQQRLESLGVKVVHFLDVDVKRNMEGVLTKLLECVQEREREHPPHPPQGGTQNGSVTH
jgi:very-short-patch-repair endonuclease